MTRAIYAVAHRDRKVERLAPCGAPLSTSRKRALSGSPLYQRIEKQLRADILQPWGLPLEEYDCAVERDEPAGSAEYGLFTARSLESLTATFTHRRTGARIVITAIWADDDGKIIQCGSNYGDLTL
ncbi:hypothetical protein [Nonomuraea sp. NPDC049784]|uniref:hypothetical protein n=1 Tax=Nonomuraea sp. NPDC049784 TaxID=3154361 RepID=UPI0033E51622